VRIVLAHSHANTFGGGERAVLEVGLHLRERHDLSLMLGGYRPGSTYQELATFPRRTLSRWQWPFAGVAPDVDAIITNSFGANLLTLRNGARVTYWVHSVRSVFLQPGANRLDLRLRRALDWFCVRRARQVIANSGFTASRIWQLYRREADAVVYPGVDLDVFHPRASGQHESRQYAVTVGRLSPEKGLTRLFDAWRDLPDAPLQVIGGGSPARERQLRGLSPSGVVFRGQLSRDDLVRAYQGAAVAVFAPHQEEFGIAPLEAMACGVPVVAWHEGGLIETVIDGQTGYLVTDEVTLRQRVRLLLRDRQLRQQLAAAARERAESFSWKRTALGIEAACSREIGPRAPAPAT
jgi:glycosyltransferase involved in cell wall biosynthesis